MPDNEADRIDLLIKWHTPELQPAPRAPGVALHVVRPDRPAVDPEAVGAA